ncbi:MAG: hypothetical protein GY931_10540 [Maribacter sp.]|nr:hypothetical protein [Maribacter sp.]
MSKDDWYRNKEWNEEIENKFFAKLKRSRSQRDQYIVIQAGALNKIKPKVSLRLVDYYFETRKESFHDVSALLSRADALLELGEIDEAIEAYKCVLAAEEEFPSIKSNTYVEYPYIVATRQIEREYEFALETLKMHVGRLTFPVDCFMWYASKALIENNPEFAQKALDAAEIKKSGFRFHQKLGLVGEEHAQTVKALFKINT